MSQRKGERMEQQVSIGSTGIPDGKYASPWKDPTTGIEYGPATQEARERVERDWRMDIHAGGPWDHEAGGQGGALAKTYDEIRENMTRVTASTEAVKFVQQYGKGLEGVELARDEQRVWDLVQRGYALKAMARTLKLKRERVGKVLERLASHASKALFDQELDSF